MRKTYTDVFGLIVSYFLWLPRASHPFVRDLRCLHLVSPTPDLLPPSFRSVSSRVPAIARSSGYHLSPFTFITYSSAAVCLPCAFHPPVRRIEILSPSRWFELDLCTTHPSETMVKLVGGDLHPCFLIRKFDRRLNLVNYARARHPTAAPE